MAQSPTPAAPAATTGRFRPLLSVAVGGYLVVALAAWLLLRLADAWWPATLLMFAPRWFLALPAGLLLPLAIFFRRWRLAGLSLAALLLVLGPVMGLAIPWPSFRQDDVHGLHLRVLTCNLHYHAGNQTSLEAVLADAHPDVVAIQEWSEDGRAEFFEGETWHIQRLPGLFLASRYPIRALDQIGTDSMGPAGLALRYELDTPLGPVHLVSLHLATAREGLYGVTHAEESGVQAIESNTALRRRQSEAVARAAELNTPVLIVGDFNTPPQSVLFRDVWSRYKDAFAEAGWGWGYTYFGGKTMVRIDHILASPEWRCERCWVAPAIGSPHRPVVADLVWPE